MEKALLLPRTAARISCCCTQHTKFWAFSSSVLRPCQAGMSLLPGGDGCGGPVAGRAGSAGSVQLQARAWPQLEVPPLQGSGANPAAAALGRKCMRLGESNDQEVWPGPPGATEGGSFQSWSFFPRKRPGAEAGQGREACLLSAPPLAGWLTLHESLGLSGLQSICDKGVWEMQQSPSSSDILP